MTTHRFIRLCFLVLLAFPAVRGMAQDPLSRLRSAGGGRGGDTALKHRVEDTITINYRYLDSSRLRKLDSSVYDFYRRNLLPHSFVDLGNSGTPARDLVFHPFMKPGWDGGWHALDPYLFTVEESQFFQTTKPYSELGYLIGGQAEQIVNLTHTQNIRPNLNALFQYRLINAPGYFDNERSNHNNYRFTTWYQSPNKRYQAFLVLLGSKLQVGENGGLRSESYLDSSAYISDPHNLPTRLGAPTQGSTSPFVSILTGSFYTVAHYLLRQQYDIIGKKDSIVTDSTVTPLFYPRFRAEHTIDYSTVHYRFLDYNPDTVTYINTYGFVSTPDTIRLSDYWKVLTNDFSLYSFPDVKNSQQFLKAGISFQNINGTFDAGTRTLYDVFVHGEYRNKTRNKKWDIEASGNFYLNGYNAGDYNVSASLRRLISRNLGYLQVGLQDVNRSVSSAWEPQSSFGFGADGTGSFNKEHITNLFAAIELPRLQLRLAGSYYLITNMPYFSDYYHPAQSSSPFNVLVIDAEKVFRIARYWVWRPRLVVQQRAGNGPVNLPLVVSTNQFGYEGKFGFRNLNIATGLEFRYFTAYKADGYSAMVGQFFTQNTETIREKLPDLNLYINFRIRSFTAYVRAENLNTMRFNSPSGFGFNNFNFVAPNYPEPGMRIRIGIFWSFVN